MSKSFSSRAPQPAAPAADTRTLPHAARTEDSTPLPAPLRGEAERRFGVDFGAVRIHAGPAAAASAQAMGAAAYTVGRDIWFGAHRWQPQQAKSQRLLAHELAHVVQQSRPGPAAGDAEARADAAATQVLQGRHVDTAALGAAPVAAQAQPTAAADAWTPPGILPPPMMPGLPQTLSSTVLEPGDAIDKDSPALVQIATAARAEPEARVRLSAALTEGSQYDSARQARERTQLSARMRRIRDVLHQLGVDEASVDVQTATGFSTSARGQVEVAVRKSAVRLLPFPVPDHTLPPEVPAAPAQAGPSLNLEFEFGPVKVSLPKEVRATLPFAFRKGYKLTLDLSYEVPAKFGLQIMLDGLPYVRVGLKGGAEVDTKSSAAVASAALVIESRATLCNATDPGETREKIKAAGEKLNKAAREFEQALPDDKLGKAIDIASAIGEIYGAVEAAKAKCKPVPRATLELGSKKVLAPGDETDPSKQPADFLGGTFTLNF